MEALLLSERERRIALADRIRSLDDVALPHLRYWNYDACERHRDVGPQVDCKYRECGGDLFSHQRVGTVWLYVTKRAILADDPGVGKTSQVLALIALLKERNELTRRALIVPNTPAVGQWGEEAARWIPGVRVLTVDSTLTRPQRIRKYAQGWDVLIIGSHLLINDRDILERLMPFDLVASDDVDALLNHENATHRAIRDISRNATHAFTLNATSLQIKLQQIHAALTPVGGAEPNVFGSLKKFEARHVKTKKVNELTSTGRVVSHRKQDGYKNIDELKTKLRPLYLRRRATELTDIRMPMLMPPQIEWLELSPLQRIRYEELQAGVLRIIREEGEDVKHLNALTQFLYGQQICAGLPALGEPDVPGASPKLDRLFHHLNNAWADRKTIAFVKNVGMVRATIQRAADSGFDVAMVWGQKQNARQRKEQVDKFWNDPDTRLLIGTSSMERSLNLQVANTVVAIDTHLNPARMKQILGRAKRAGSPHERVFMYTYLMRDTQEERYMQVLRERQAIYDTVFEEESDMYEALSPIQLLQLMQP